MLVQTLNYPALAYRLMESLIFSIVIMAAFLVPLCDFL